MASRKTTPAPKPLMEVFAEADDLEARSVAVSIEAARVEMPPEPEPAAPAPTNDQPFGEYRYAGEHAVVFPTMRCYGPDGWHTLLAEPGETYLLEEPVPVEEHPSFVLVRGTDSLPEYASMEE